MSTSKKKSKSVKTTNWRSTVDEPTGTLYYWNIKTKETSWDKPSELYEYEKEYRNDDNIVGYWYELLDLKKNKLYYYNKQSTTLTWSRPGCLGPLKKSNIIRDESERELWEQAEDPKTNRLYWYHKYTKESTWDNPSGINNRPIQITLNESKSNYKKIHGLFGQVNFEEESKAVRKEKQKQEKQFRELIRKKHSLFVRKVDEVEEEDEDEGDDEGNDEPTSTEPEYSQHRHGVMNRLLRRGIVTDTPTMLKFKKGAIAKSMLKKNRLLDSEAIDMFKNIQCFMGDRKSSIDQIKHAIRVIEYMFEHKGLVDEAYVQIKKQTTENPNPQHCVKGWKLFLLCLAVHPPSCNLQDHLDDYFEKAIGEKTAKGISATDEKQASKENEEKTAKEISATDEKQASKEIVEIVEIAKRCKDFMAAGVELGRRKNVPCEKEMNNIMEGKDSDLIIRMVDNSEIKMKVDPFDLVGHVEKVLLKQFSISATRIFSLYERADVPEEKRGKFLAERILNSEDRIMDIKGGWETNNEDQETYIPKYEHFLFKVKLVLPTTLKMINTDRQAINFLYSQANIDMIAEVYPHNQKDVAGLAAFHLQVTQGDWTEKCEEESYLRKNGMQNYVPLSLLTGDGTRSGSIDKELEKDYEEKILENYKKITGMKLQNMDLKLNYLLQVQQLAFYGSTMFEVEQNQIFKTYPSTLMLAVNHFGILLMDPERNKLLERYPYSDIITFGHSISAYVVVVGSLVQQRKLTFKTKIAKYINNLVQDYIDCKLITDREGESQENPGEN